MNPIELQAMLKCIERAIENVRRWEIVLDAPEGYDVYRGVSDDVHVLVGGRPDDNRVLDGTAIFHRVNSPIIRLTPEMAQRALELARGARRAQAS